MKKPLRHILFLILMLCLPSHVIGADTTATEASQQDLLLADDEFYDDDLYDDEFYEDDAEFEIYDPLEPVNRFFFGFNDHLYEWLLKPFTDAYIWAVPLELRESAGNFFLNLAAPVRLLNTLLQGKFDESVVVVNRFLINSTLGVYGLVDIASIEFEIEPTRADFGQTLGRWGLNSGVYVCWPLIGPSSLRDTVGLVVDAYTHPIPYFHDSRVLDIAYYTSNRINTLSLNPNVYEDLKKFSIDPYISSRQAYFEYRKALIESSQGI